jgi:hypothetical protein
VHNFEADINHAILRGEHPNPAHVDETAMWRALGSLQTDTMVEITVNGDNRIVGARWFNDRGLIEGELQLGSSCCVIA